jgi:CIC family chloride channel protein
VDPLAFAGPQKGALFLVLGVVGGFLAVLYNRTLLATLTLANRLDRWPVEVRAGLIGAAVGVLAWFLPHLVGGGGRRWRSARSPGRRR